jgi:hypothetical protein
LDQPLAEKKLILGPNSKRLLLATTDETQRIAKHGAPRAAEGIELIIMGSG